ncbi:MAG: cupredoxin domain-containing protein [Actinomycetota bacterium]
MKLESARLDPGAPPAGSRGDWRWLSRWTAVVLAAVLVTGMFFLGELIPPLMLFGVLLITGAALVRRRDRAGGVLLAVLFVLVVALNAPFIVPSLSVPASTVDFLLAAISTPLAVVGAIAAVATARRRPVTTDLPRKVALGASTVIALAVVVAAVASFTYSDAVARPGDIRVTTEDFAFSKTALTTDGGKVAVFVDNKDGALHTFTVEELGVDLQVPAGKSARVVFDAGSGSYAFICKPHEMDMKGTLEVD